MKDPKYYEKKIRRNNIALGIIMAICVWMSVSNIIQAIKCPQMSQTELLLHIPKSFICDWAECDRQVNNTLKCTN